MAAFFSQARSLISADGSSPAPPNQKRLCLEDFLRLDFPNGLPDLYFVTVYVLFGEGALEYATGVLKVGALRMEAEHEGTRVRLRLRRTHKAPELIQKDALLKRRALRKVKRAFPCAGGRRLYRQLTLLATELLDYGNFPARLGITEASFIANSGVLFGERVPRLAGSLFHQLAHHGGGPAEEIEFPRLLAYFRERFFRKVGCL